MCDTRPPMAIVLMTRRVLSSLGKIRIRNTGLDTTTRRIRKMKQTKKAQKFLFLIAELQPVPIRSILGNPNQAGYGTYKRSRSRSCEGMVNEETEQCNWWRRSRDLCTEARVSSMAIAGEGEDVGAACACCSDSMVLSLVSLFPLM